MKNEELQAARRLLMLDVREAAEMVGGVAVRAWQYWEAGRSQVPADVRDRMRSLLRTRAHLLSRRAREGFLPRYFVSFAEFQEAHPEGARMDWRLGQSVAAELLAGFSTREN